MVILAQHHANFGEMLVGKCFVNTNIITGESKGTAVVEMKDDDVYNKLLMLKEIIYGNNQFEIEDFFYSSQG